MFFIVVAMDSVTFSSVNQFPDVLDVDYSGKEDSGSISSRLEENRVVYKEFPSFFRSFTRLLPLSRYKIIHCVNHI